MTNRIKQTLKLSAIGACLGLVSPASMAGTEALTAEECSLIRGYNAIEGNDFIEHFAKMVHQVEFCQKTNGACELPLKKRVEDYYLIIFHAELLKSKKIGIAVEDEMIAVLSDISNATGINHILEIPKGTNRYIFVNFIDPDFVAENYEAYLKAVITHPEFSNHSWRKERFDYFIKTDQPCMGLISVTKDHLLEAGHI